MNIGVYKVAMDSPADTSRLEAMIQDRVIDPSTIVACIGKTEGNGGANDFTRALATVSYQSMLAKYVGHEQAACIAFVWSGGTEGVLSPHATFFTRIDDAIGASDEPGLALSIQTTPAIGADQVGRASMVEEVAKAKRRAMEDAGVKSPADVHYVQVKGPLLTPAGIRDALERGQSVVTADPNVSKGYARGAMALGVAFALGEVERPESGWDSVINKDLSKFSSVASTSAGGELKSCEVILMANTKKGNGSFSIGHARMYDAIDAEGICQAIRNAGVSFDFLSEEDEARIVAVFAKAEASPMVKGWRTTMLSDADIHYERHARAAAGAGGTEHQCAPGSAPIAVIVRRPT